MTEQNYTRRTFATLLAGAGVTTLAGCMEGLASWSSKNSTRASRAVGPDATGLTDGERADFVARMAETYGSDASERITPGGDADVQIRQPGIDPVGRVWDGTETLTVTDDSGEVAVASDNYAALYETDMEGEDGGQYYLYWLWSSVRATSDWHARTVWTHIDLTNDADITVYDPASERTENGTVGPHPDRTGQDSDEFAVRWTNDGPNRASTRTITGVCVERRQSSDTRNFDWTVSLDAEKR